MSKLVAEKQINSFVKGLITEASPLTYPENASLSEQNFELLVNGIRRRRLGIDYEYGYVFNDVSASVSAGEIPSARVDIAYWPNPGGDTTKYLAIIRIGDSISCINLLDSNPSTAYLSGHGISNLNADYIDMEIVGGYLLIATYGFLRQLVCFGWDTSLNRLCNPLTTASVSPEYPYVEIRDFYGVYEALAIDERPAAYTVIHQYNLYNQGWPQNGVGSTCGVASNPSQCTAITANPATGTALYPSNSDVWYYGKNTSYVYDPLLLFKNSTDATPAPRGHYIIGYASRKTDREAKSLLAGLPTDTELGTISCLTSYAGRAFYSGVSSQVTGDRLSPNYSGYIFFSQVVTSFDKIAKCYQEADPTSGTISDIVDTDGGTIHIPEISKVYKLFPFGDTLLVFAENGVWEISGGNSGGFTATNYTVSKITSIGTNASRSVIQAGNNIFYWSDSGIFVLSPDASTGRLSVQSITTTTIQTLYDSIGGIAKKHVKAIFDEQKNVVSWLYNDDTTGVYTETNYVNTYNCQLNLNLNLQAFSKYKFAEPIATEALKPRPSGFIKIPNYAATTENNTILAGADTVIANVDNVITTTNVNISREPKNKYLIIKDRTFTIGELNNTSFYDWQIEYPTGADAEAYLITGYDGFGDYLRDKEAPYVQFYFNRTEDGYHVVGDDLVLNNQSSCLVQAQWGWTDSANSGKWGQSFQAYRLLRNYTPSGVGDTFDYGESVIVTKNKLRGSGKVLSLKISSEAGKDMQLLGWGMTITGKSEV